MLRSVDTRLNARQYVLIEAVFCPFFSKIILPKLFDAKMVFIKL